MFAVETVRIAILLATFLVLDECCGYPSIKLRQGLASHCTGCGDLCHKCEYGVVRSIACGIQQCAKGPDERCGGPREIYGICAEGMHCSCNRCAGCSSKKFRCATLENPCLPHKSSELRDVNRFGRLPTVI